MSGVELQVGRRYGREDWDDETVVVTAVGQTYALCIGSWDSYEHAFRLTEPWVEVLPPIEVVRGATWTRRGVEVVELLVPADRADEAVKRIKGES